jgi:pilus assembly protein CpaC
VLIMKGSRAGSVLLTAKAPGTTNVMVWERGHDEPTVWNVEVVDAAAQAVLDASTPQVKAYGGTSVLRGTAGSLDAHERAVAVAKNMSPKGAVIDRSTLAGKNVVQVDVRVVEFSRSVLKQVGFNFFKQSNGFSFGSFSPGGVQSYNGGSGPGTAAYIPTLGAPVASAFNLVVNAAGHGIFADLSLLEANNLARARGTDARRAVRPERQLSRRRRDSGAVAAGLGSTAIQWKQYGVGLSLTPTVLSPNRIALKVAPESSQLDFVNSVTISGVAVPGITTRRADTTVELGDGESFVIGGLIDRQTMSNVSKVPLLGDLPIIGTFFKNLNYQQNDKELLIIVTPHLVAPIAKGAVLPATPGELAEQHDGPVWRSYLGGAASPDAAPGFSK